MSFAIFELKCPACEVEYAQLLSEDDDVSMNCPSCSQTLEKGKKLSGEDVIACGISSGSS